MIAQPLSVSAYESNNVAALKRLTGWGPLLNKNFFNVVLLNQRLQQFDSLRQRKRKRVGEFQFHACVP